MDATIEARSVLCEEPHARPNPRAPTKLLSPRKGNSQSQEVWSSPILFESEPGASPKAIIYISKGQPVAARPEELRAEFRRSRFQSTRRVLFSASATLLLLLVMVKILPMGWLLFRQHASTQAEGRIGVIKRTKQHSDMKELFVDMVPQLHQADHGPITARNLASPRIPRLIHQTYHGRVIYQTNSTYVSRRIPEGLPTEIAASWRRHNGHAWQHRFYDDDARLTFVKAEFPEYLDAYSLLSNETGRSDFFRYLVILKHGGVYADVDVECRKPLDSIIKPDDSMVVGWEAEVPTDNAAVKRGLVRRRQVLQWFFAAAPAHPVLRDICDHIAAHVHTVFSPDPRRDALERTGPGVWTDTVLRYAQQPVSSGKGGKWLVRILPRMAFGATPSGLDGVPVASPVVVHHFLDPGRSLIDCHNLSCVQQWLAHQFSSLVKVDEQREVTGAQHPCSSSPQLFPVSTSFEPPFVMMVDLIGHGDMQSGSDVSAAITDWGSWQAGPGSPRHPTAVDALVGFLGRRWTAGVFVDVGAGQGFYSLAAAARGHRVVSFESSAPSLTALHASLSYNSLQGLVRVHEVHLGAREEMACLRRRGNSSQADASDVHLRRGYGDPAVHGVRGPECEQWAHRSTLDKLLGGSRAGSLRLSANGWEGWIVQGGEKWLREQPPGVILIEFSPALIRRSGYEAPGKLLEQLYSWGYTQAAHTGHMCQQRWRSLTRPDALDLGHLGRRPMKAQGSQLRQPAQPTWCKLTPDAFHVLAESSVPGDFPENVMFIHSSHRSGGNVSAVAADTATTVSSDNQMPAAIFTEAPLLTLQATR